LVNIDCGNEAWYLCCVTKKQRAMLTAMMIGNRIAEARKKISISQAQLAQKLFISSQAVGKWEPGESMPDIITFNLLAELLGVDLNFFSENFASVIAETAVDKPLDNQSEELTSPVVM
jgi:transcriptional regulator with XRE-family HTH domain